MVRSEVCLVYDVNTVLLEHSQLSCVDSGTERRVGILSLEVVRRSGRTAGNEYVELITVESGGRNFGKIGSYSICAFSSGLANCVITFASAGSKDRNRRQSKHCAEEQTNELLCCDLAIVHSFFSFIKLFTIPVDAIHSHYCTYIIIHD